LRAFRFSSASGVRIRFCGQNCGPGAVAHAELELPFDCPRLGLLILAAFDEDLIVAFEKVAFEFVLIHALSPVVFVTSKEQFAIEPHLPRVLASEAQLRLTFGGGFKSGVRVGGGLLERRKRFVEIKLPIVVRAFERLPFNLFLLTLVGFLKGRSLFPVDTPSRSPHDPYCQKAR